MRNFTFKGLFLTAVFMLLGCLSIQAADDDLITRQITIKLDKAGTLPDRIGSSKKYKITNLKLVGEINGTDWKMIREMAGRDYSGKDTEGKLSVLDLSEAKIVNGGDEYYDHGGCTSNDQMGFYAFYNCSRLTSLTLPAGITSIDEFAFMNCSKLTSVVIPSGVTSIESETFAQCTGLTSIVIPSSVTSIGDGAFSNCDSLSDIIMTSGVTSIGNQVFEFCYDLASIIIPSSVTSIGKGTFKGCYNLTSLYSYRPDPVAVDSNVFLGIDANKCTLYVPQGSFGNYYVTSGWDYFSKIVEFDPTGIDAVTTKSDAKEVSRYSVDGQKLDTPVKGLNIVKYNDGSIKKVVVE